MSPPRLREVIVLAVRWYLRYGLSHRDVEEPLAERGTTVAQLDAYFTDLRRYRTGPHSCDEDSH
jgi:hypothetical protein